ncbi:tetratricopeptide repeat protein [Lonepinella koalarum]|uniref:Cytochrome c-type biogenesis protein CcmH/formate-dependent nitrite reductase complex subunit NrfG n=1 Tax=Lonepinella koalarum TaxID=53417 RepID=A0A4V2PUC0_9PAST|nr:c-type cytochrome biogenesis protein [Lonepinella koalarum]TCK69951.1 cytochrome c-type biogenesis protein CcmH/formate-dependent nitrite reductase complex subunit NrfG [Lonepinella koalarum]TFJ90443.1 c-type cytochrome biogenesis protein [Lonepinella koalarum]
MNTDLSFLWIGIAIFALIGLLLFVPLGRKIDWHRNYRQQKNIELYQQQMASNPNTALTNEFSQRLLADEQILQQQADSQVNSAVYFSPIFTPILWLVLFTLPLAYYFSLDRLNDVQQGKQDFKQKQHQLSTATVNRKNDDYIISIQQKLRQDPNDSDRWFELGQAYLLNNEFENALIAYGNAEQLVGSKANILGQAATALYYQAGQKITPKTQQLIETALQQDPNETASLSLLASDAFLKTDYANALKYWQRLLDSGRSEVDRRKTIESMQMAEKLLKTK